MNRGLIKSVEDLEFGSLANSKYDLALFACGSEPRCVNIATRIQQNGIVGNNVLLRISEADDAQAEENLAFFENSKVFEIVGASVNQVDPIYGILNERLGESIPSSEIKLLVDYSSMPRAWYSALLNWSIAIEKSLVIDFVYSKGAYEGKWTPIECGTLEYIGDFSDVSDSNQEGDKEVIIGLGLDELAPYTILTGFDINEAFAFITHPGSSKTMKQEVVKVNSSFLKDYLKAPLMQFPISKVSEAYQALSEIASVVSTEKTVVLVPLGPKPLVLASILVGCQYSNTPCYKLNHEHKRPYTVRSLGPEDEHIVCTRVKISQGDDFL